MVPPHISKDKSISTGATIQFVFDTPETIIITAAHPRTPPTVFGTFTALYIKKRRTS